MRLMRTSNLNVRALAFQVLCAAVTAVICCGTVTVPQASAASKGNSPSSPGAQSVANRAKTPNPSFPSAATWPGDTFLAPVSIQTLPSQSFFYSGSSSLTPTAIQTLRRKVALILSLDPHARIRITGHTDSQGSAQYNLALSLARARVVMRWLKSHGLSKNYMESRGVGFSEPVIQDRDANGNLIQKAAQANRRVVIELLS